MSFYLMIGASKNKGLQVEMKYVYHLFSFEITIIVHNKFEYKFNSEKNKFGSRYLTSGQFDFGDNILRLLKRSRID